MKTIIEYQCEICRKRYESEEKANLCEAKGVFNPELFPVGLLFPLHHNGFVGIFGIADPRQYEGDPHMGETSYLGFRAANYAGDSVFENGLCGHDFLTSFKKLFGIGATHWAGKWMKPEDFERPEYHRAIEYLKNRGITPRYVSKDGEIIEA